MGKCSVENCNNECFEQEDKCILHCEKDDSFQSNDNNVKFFYYALIEYITPLVLRASKEYKISIGSIEHQKTIIWNFLDGLDNNDRTFDIKEALTNKITLKDIRFPINGIPNAQYNYDKVLNKLINIEFNNCYFNDDLSLNNYKNLTFRRCTFLGEWYHIFCNEIKYIECIFEDFIIDNISEDKLIVENHLLYNCGFKNIRCSGTRFKKRFFKFNNVNQYKKIENIELTHCEFDEDFILNITNNEDKEEKEYFELTNINFEHSIFHRKVKIQFCDLKVKANFYNTSFKDLADFYNTKFNEVVFKRTDFEKVSVFSEAEFNQDLDFKYVKFLDKSIFRDMVIKGKLNLRDTIFADDATFLDITSEKRKRNDNKEFYGEPKVIQVANRETARVIKNFYDKSNNIIEANKFYALEMKERRKELDAKSGFVEWIVFYLHEVSSNHSQSWLTALLWIVLLGFFYTMEINGIPLLTFFITLLTIDVMIEYFFKKYTSFIRWYNKIQPYILILFYMPYIFIIHVGEIPYFMSLAFLNEIAKNINLFSKLNLENITLGLLVYKIVLSYLMYQFVVAVRQNTRRK